MNPDVQRFCALLDARLQKGRWGSIDPDWLKYILGHWPKDELDEVERGYVDALEQLIARVVADYQAKDVGYAINIWDSGAPIRAERGYGSPRKYHVDRTLPVAADQDPCACQVTIFPSDPEDERVPEVYRDEEGVLGPLAGFYVEKLHLLNPPGQVVADLFSDRFVDANVCPQTPPARILYTRESPLVFRCKSATSESQVLRALLEVTAVVVKDGEDPE